MNSTVLCFGEILWDLLPAGPQLGGAPLNFAFRMHELGNKAYSISRLGRDDLGEKAEHELEHLGLPLDFVQLTDEKTTGTVLITLDRGQPEYTITPDAAYDHIGASQTMLDTAATADCVYFGTLAQRSDASRHTLHALLDAVHPGAIKLCDLNLRPHCYTHATVLDSLRRADVVKLSGEEIAVVAEMVGLQPRDASDPAACATKLLQLFTLRACLVTRGEHGVYAVGDDGSIVDLPGVPTNVVDAVGAGDAFTAGFADAFLGGASLDSACRQGNAIGALAAGRCGGTARIAPEEREEIMKLQK